MTSELPELVDTDFACRYLGKTKETVQQWLRNGTIPGVKVGKSWYIRTDDLLARLSSPLGGAVSTDLRPTRVGDGRPPAVPPSGGDSPIPTPAPGGSTRNQRQGAGQ